MIPEEVSELLLDLERQLMDPEFRKNKERVSAQLAEEFREFGSSGRIWAREAILELLAEEIAFTAPQIEDFAVQRITPDTILVTYRAVPSDARNTSLRSSIWVYRDGRWKMLFHQGTKIANP